MQSSFKVERMDQEAKKASSKAKNDFSEYMWMGDEQSFDSEIQSAIEEEDYIRSAIELLLDEEEQRESVYYGGTTTDHPPNKINYQFNGPHEQYNHPEYAYSAGNLDYNMESLQINSQPQFINQQLYYPNQPILNPRWPYQMVPRQQQPPGPDSFQHNGQNHQNGYHQHGYHQNGFQSNSHLQDGQSQGPLENQLPLESQIPHVSLKFYLEGKQRFGE